MIQQLFFDDASTTTVLKSDPKIRYLATEEQIMTPTQRTLKVTCSELLLKSIAESKVSTRIINPVTLHI